MNRPIIDAHAHIFTRIDGRSGGTTTAAGHLGKIETDGQSAPFLPPADGITSFSIAVLEELMAQSGVEKALLLQNPTIGTINEEIETIIAEKRSKFAGVIQVDPLSANACDEIKRFSACKGFRALKLEMGGWGRIYPQISYRDAAMRSIIKTAGETGLVIMVDTGPIRSPGYRPKDLAALVDEFGEFCFQFEHLGFLERHNAADAEVLRDWNALIDLGLRDNVYLGYSAVGTLLAEEYPCAQSLELLRIAVERVGAEKILWGTDVPGTLNDYTYRQMLNHVRLRADFLSDGQRAKIMGENAERLYFSG